MNDRKSVTWEQLIEAEPRLQALLEKAQAVTDDESKPYFCTNRLWYGRDAHDGGFRQQVENLVGFHAESKNPILTTSQAYDVAYQTVYEALPPCRNCACFPAREVIEERMRG